MTSYLNYNNLLAVLGHDLIEDVLLWLRDDVGGV